MNDYEKKYLKYKKKYLYLKNLQNGGGVFSSKGSLLNQERKLSKLLASLFITEGLVAEPNLHSSNLGNCFLFLKCPLIVGANNLVSVQSVAFRIAFDVALTAGAAASLDKT